jgi:hypothetical protein
MPVDPIVINGSQYADFQNSSYLAYAATLTEKHLWQQPAAPAGNALGPVQLSIHGQLLLVSYGRFVEARSRGTGEVLWMREVYANLSFALTPAGLGTLDQAGSYAVLEMDQKATTSIDLPMINDRTYLDFIHLQDKSVVYAYTVNPTPTNSPSDQFFGPSCVFTRVDLAGRVVRWEFIRQEELLGVVLSQDGNWYCFATDKALHIFPREALNDSAVISVPCETLLCCSFDHEGNVLFVERRKEDVVLKRCTMDGKTEGELSLGSSPVVVQPPASTPDGSIYLVVDNYLTCVQGDIVAWQYQLPAEPGKALITVLQDGSVLAAAGASVVQVSPQGETEKILFLGSPVTCRPIVDETGRVYIGTLGTIRCER